MHLLLTSGEKKLMGHNEQPVTGTVAPPAGNKQQRAFTLSSFRPSHVHLPPSTDTKHLTATTVIIINIDKY